MAGEVAVPEDSPKSSLRPMGGLTEKGQGGGEEGIGMRRRSGGQGGGQELMASRFQGFHAQVTNCWCLSPPRWLPLELCPEWEDAIINIKKELGIHRCHSPCSAVVHLIASPG